MTPELTIDFPSLPTIVVSDETIYYEIGVPNADPQNTKVTIDLKGSFTISADLDFVAIHENAALYRGFVQVPNFAATHVLPDETVTFTVTVTSGGQTAQEESELFIVPSRGAWVRTVDKHYHPVTIFGAKLASVYIDSPFVSVSPMTGLLWAQVGNRLVSFSRSGAPSPSFDLIGNRMIGMVAGTQVVATIEVTGHEQSELVVYEPITGSVRLRAEANDGPYFTHSHGGAPFSPPSETVFYGRRLGGVTNIFSFRLGDTEPQQVKVQPDPRRIIFLLPNGNPGSWLNGHSIVDMVREEKVSPSLVADYTGNYLAVDDLGLWLIPRPQHGNPKLIRYEWEHESAFFHYSHAISIPGSLHPIAHEAQMLTSSRSCAVAFIAANRSPVGNLHLVTPLGIKSISFDKQIHSVFASTTPLAAYWATVLWHRETLGPVNGIAQAHVISQPHTIAGGVQMHMENGETLSKATDKRGRATIPVRLKTNSRSFLLTNGDDTNRSVAYGHVAYPQKIPFQVGVAENLEWVAYGIAGDVTVGLARSNTLVVRLGEVGAPHQGAKLTGILSDKGTLWTQAVQPLVRLSYKETNLSFPEATRILAVAPVGEMAWYLEALDNSGKRFRVVRWDGFRHEEGVEIEDAHSLAAINEEKIVIIGRSEGPTQPMFAQLATLDLIGQKKPIDGLFSLSAVAHGPRRIWISGKNSSGRKLLVTLNEKGDVEHGPILPAFDFEDRLLTGANGQAWGYRQATGAEASHVLLWTDPRQPPLSAQHGGGEGVAIYAGPMQAAVLTRTSRPGVRCREFRLEGSNLRSLVDISAGDEDMFLWKSLELS